LVIARRRRIRREGWRRGGERRVESTRRLRGWLNRANEAIAAARNGFDEAWCIGVVTQDATEFFDGCVEGMVEIDERVLGPDALTKFLARDQYSRALKQSRQDLKRLTLAADAHAMFAKNTSLKIELENRKTNDGIVWTECAHGGLDVFDVTAQGTLKKLETTRRNKTN
jgi:hypothetical protein